MALPTAARVRELFDYDSASGLLRWRQARTNIKTGAIAGSSRRAYVRVSVDNKVYRAHHIIWLWMMGEWPSAHIDHRDLNKNNNAWTNLRLATKSQNGANRPVQANSKSGLKGAYFYKAYNRWQSTIQKDGRTIYLGYFDTAEQAHVAYCQAASALYGEFARAS